MVPSYISNALADAQSAFVEYLTAAAPTIFLFVICLGAFFLIVRLIKKAVLS